MNKLRVFELVFLSIVTCTSAGKQSFDGGNYVVEWMHLPGTKEIEFNITVKTIGWVGLGISKENTEMKKLDVVVGGFKAGKHYLWDMYADGKAKPTEDTQKDVTFVSGSESNGVTNLRFKRKLDTGDTTKDNAIQVNGSYFLAWAFNANDATDPLNFLMHTSRGYSGRDIILVTASASVTMVSPTAGSNSSIVTPTATGKPMTTSVASGFSPAVFLLVVAAATVHALNNM